MIKYDIFNKESEDFLFQYLNANSPTGFEYTGQKIWMSYIEQFVDEVHHDVYGTVYGVINPGKDYKVVIEAHADEIAWYVNYISEEGYIYVKRNGGSDHIIAPSKRVWLHTPERKVRGVFGWPAIHTRRTKLTDHKPELNKIFVDVGAQDRDEVLEMGIHPGTVITFDDNLEKFNNRYYMGRALDNRAGGFCIAQVTRLIKENNVDLPYSLYIVNAVQEEVGLRGAQMIAEHIAPDVAIITDVCHDTTTPMINKKDQGDIKAGDGPDLTFAPAVHNKLLQLLRDVAKDKDIPVQLSASSRMTGTDTDAFAYSNSGVASALISIPLKYMHTTVETAAISDLENVVKLYLETLLKIQYKHNFSYFS